MDFIIMKIVKIDVSLESLRKGVHRCAQSSFKGARMNEHSVAKKSGFIIAVG